MARRVGEGWLMAVCVLASAGAFGGAYVARMQGGSGDVSAEEVAALRAEVEALREQVGGGPETMAEAVVGALERQMRAELGTARLSANETAAIATLRNLISAQAQFQQSGKADTDHDGTGEYGGFAELSGGAAGRMSGHLLPPVLSGGFRVLDPTGAVSRSGYFFRIFLPDGGGRGVGEPQAAFSRASGLDADLAEITWCAYAWPVSHGQSANRTFFANQDGDVFACEVAAWSGRGAGPPADAAFRSSGSITGAVDVDGAGQTPRDADATWVQVN